MEELLLEGLQLWIVLFASEAQGDAQAGLSELDGELKIARWVPGLATIEAMKSALENRPAPNPPT
jgi:hypothetical protein